MSNPSTTKSARDWEYLKEWLSVQATLSVKAYYDLRRTDPEKSREQDMRNTHFEEVLRQMEAIDAIVPQVTTCIDDGQVVTLTRYPAPPKVLGADGQEATP